MGRLEDLCAVSVPYAVEHAVHRRDPALVHRRYPKGECPHCGLLRNLLEAQDVLDGLESFRSASNDAVEAIRARFEP